MTPDGQEGKTQKTNKAYACITTLTKIEFCGSKWCHFHGKNEDGKDFEESGKLYYMGNCLRNSKIDISPWDHSGFLDVLAVMVARKIRVGWNLLDGYNLYPDQLPYEKDVQELTKDLQCLKENSLETLQLDLSVGDITEYS